MIKLKTNLFIQLHKTSSDGNENNSDREIGGGRGETICLSWVALPCLRSDDDEAGRKKGRQTAQGKRTTNKLCTGFIIADSRG